MKTHIGFGIFARGLMACFTCLDRGLGLRGDDLRWSSLELLASFFI